MIATAAEGAPAAVDVACVRSEPAPTNCGFVPPLPGLTRGEQNVCRRAGALFVLDETHAVSSSHGVHARVRGLAPDLLVVVGKAIAGGSRSMASPMRWPSAWPRAGMRCGRATRRSPRHGRSTCSRWRHSRRTCAN